MKFTIACLADAANISADGKLNILGQFDLIGAQEFPVRLPKMDLVLQIEAATAEGPSHTIEIRVVDEDGKPLFLARSSLHLEQPFRPGHPLRTQIIIPIVNAEFPGPATYSFEIFLDGAHQVSVPLHVMKPESRQG